jgi:putative ABC transport system ATP-binding protein
LESALLFTDIRNFTVESWRNTIGLVPQDPVLFTGTIADNIAYGRNDVTREQIEEAARAANCEFVWGMPEGFDTQSKYPQYLFNPVLTLYSW